MDMVWRCNGGDDTTRSMGDHWGDPDLSCAVVALPLELVLSRGTRGSIRSVCMF